MTQSAQPIVGIIEGRLSPSTDGRLQSFPWATWQEEFPIAGRYGFDAIELVFGADRHESHPLLTDEGVRIVRQLSAEHAIRVPSVCGDYFMTYPLSSDATIAERSVQMLRRVVQRSATLGADRVLLPLLEAASVRSQTALEAVRQRLSAVVPDAEACGIEIALEADLSGRELAELVDSFESSAVACYYDTGNCTACGHDVVRDLQILGRRVHAVHLKDRRKGDGTSLYLGTGDVDFAGVFRVLAGRGFGGPYILQAARGEEYLEAAASQLAFVRRHIREAASAQRVRGA